MQKHLDLYRIAPPSEGVDMMIDWHSGPECKHVSSSTIPLLRIPAAKGQAQWNSPSPKMVSLLTSLAQHQGTLKDGGGIQ